MAKSYDIQRLKEEIVARLDLKTFYERFLNGQSIHKKSDGWSERVKCPIHGDQNTPNFFVNFSNGNFKCHACGASGSVFDFYLLMRGLSVDDNKNFSVALTELATLSNINIEEWSKTQDFSAKPQQQELLPKVNKADQKDTSLPAVSTQEVDVYCGNLAADHIKYLNGRGLKLPTIQEFKIGWNPDAKAKNADGEWVNGRYTIPIRNKHGKVMNIRMYSPDVPPEYKMINTKERGSPVRLFMLDKLLSEDWQNVVICEGEWDCILLNQEFKLNKILGWGAVTGTHGANTFDAEWVEYFHGKKVYFLFDCDEPGKTAAANHASKHFLAGLQAGTISSLKIIDLPLDGSKEMKDITDYFVKAEHKIDELLVLMLNAPELLAGGVDAADATVDSIKVDSFVDAIRNASYVDRRITVPLTVSGQSSRVYHAVRSYSVPDCPMMRGATNNNSGCCSLDAGERIIPYENNLYIAACMSTDGEIYKRLQGIACQMDQKCKVKIHKKVVMEEYFAHQVVERWRVQEGDDGHMHNAQELVQASIYFLQPEAGIQIGPQNYIATGWIKTHPKTSVATMFVEDMIPLEDDWKKFTLTKKENKELISQIIKNWTTENIIQDIINNVTCIYNSEDILYVILLTYLSPLWMVFNGTLTRGWINSCIIGDSGTGKSESYNRISDWLELGDSFSVLSGTRTGLLYAIKQKNSEWHVSIGRYVQASGKIIAVDETQETTAEDIKRMAIAMDTGWLEVSQVASGGYHTQTRTLFIMNPKRGHTLSDYSYGCTALKECFDPMFIRRLDVAAFISVNHTHDFYNQRKNQEKIYSVNSGAITAKHFKALIYWAWTRKPSQIVWTEPATDQCLKSATELSKTFGHVDEIPLVNPQDFRNNLARLSAAYAVLARSFDIDMEVLLIKPEHVVKMEGLITMLYNSPSCKLGKRSIKAKSKNQLDDYGFVENEIEEMGKYERTANKSGCYTNSFYQLLMLFEDRSMMSKRDIQDVLGRGFNWVTQKISRLQALNLVEISHRSVFKTTRRFNIFMHKWQEKQGVYEMLEEARKNLGKDTPLNEERSHRPEEFFDELEQSVDQDYEGYFLNEENQRQRGEQEDTQWSKNPWD